MTRFLLFRLEHIVETDPFRGREAAGLLAYLRHRLSCRGATHLLAVEYTLDDGAVTHGNGDALLYDVVTRTLIVLESKSGLRSAKGSQMNLAAAAAAAESQAQRLSGRIHSWLRHSLLGPRLQVDQVVHQAVVV
jgi:hypothetical protein